MEEKRLFKGYEIVELLTYGCIPENTYLRQYINNEVCESDALYVVHNKTLCYANESLQPTDEARSSLLSDVGIRFEVLGDIRQEYYPLLIIKNPLTIDEKIKLKNLFIESQKEMIKFCNIYRYNK